MSLETPWDAGTCTPPSYNESSLPPTGAVSEKTLLARVGPVPCSANGGHVRRRDKAPFPVSARVMSVEAWWGAWTSTWPNSNESSSLLECQLRLSGEQALHLYLAIARWKSYLPSLTWCHRRPAKTDLKKIQFHSNQNDQQTTENHLSKQEWGNLNLNEKRQSVDTNIKMTKVLEFSDKDFKAVFLKLLWWAIRQAI